MNPNYTHNPQSNSKRKFQKERSTSTVNHCNLKCKCSKCTVFCSCYERLIASLLTQCTWFKVNLAKKNLIESLSYLTSHFAIQVAVHIFLALQSNHTLCISSEKKELLVYKKNMEMWAPDSCSWFLIFMNSSYIFNSSNNFFHSLRENLQVHHNICQIFVQIHWH